MEKVPLEDVTIIVSVNLVAFLPYKFNDGGQLLFSPSRLVRTKCSWVFA